MKKSLIALAALAAAGAASAQSSVQLYGVMDANFGTYKNTLSAPTPYPGASNGQSQAAVNSSGMRNSRWGLKGTEDLGGGLKANFVLEQGINGDDGTILGTGFGREANVGVSGAFGAIKLGRVYSAYDDVHHIVNNSANHNFAATRDVWNTVGAADYDIRVNNAIRYESVNYNGFSGSVVYGFGENKGLNTAGATIDAGKTVALSVKYANGPLAVVYGHQNQKVQNGTATAAVGATPARTATQNSTGIDSTKYNLLGASYDLGVIKVVGSYNKVSVTGGRKDTEWQLGLSAPVGPVTVFAGYAAAKTKVNDIDAGKATGYNLAAVYPLSKRTDLYTVYKNVKDKKADGTPDLTGSNTDSKLNQFSVGIRHAF